MEDAFAGHLGAITPAPSRGQAASAISSPGDPSERQADAVAHRVVGQPKPVANAVRPDFAGVRVHTGPTATAAARSVNASAYTVGQHVVLAQPLSDSTAGRTLLAHELTHVVQQGRNPSLANEATGPRVQRKCGHDGKATGCYASPRLGAVKLTDPSGRVETHDIGDLIVANMAKRFGGTWLPRVTSPPSAKSTTRGFVDGLKVTVGSTLHGEIVEVKPRSTAVAGGCDLADTEAEGYRVALNAIAGDFVALSKGLAARGGLRIPQGSKATAAQSRILRDVGATGTNPNRYWAWQFYNSLQNRLGTTFLTPFDALNIAVNKDGSPGTTYEAAPPWLIDCIKNKKKRLGTTTLVYEVSGKGGASYGCDKDCPDDDDEERRRKTDQPRAEKGRDKAKYKRVSQEGDEKDIREPGQQPPVHAPGRDQPGADQPNAGQPSTDQPGADASGGGGVDATEITAILASAAALTAAAAKAKSVAERRLLEAAYKKKMAELAAKGATSTAERMMINGVKLGSKQLAHKFEKEAVEVLEKDLEKLALKQGKKAARGAFKKVAGKTIAKVVPFLSVVLIASDALAMADHISKGGTIEFGLSGSDADLSGDTKVKGKGDKPSGASQDAKLTDTKVDIETTGIPDVSGGAEIETKNVTITGKVTGDGTPVTVSFKTKLQNTTITIKHGGVIRGGKVVLSGDVTVKDSQIEIDLPKEASAASPGKPVTITGQKLKITKVGSGTGGPPGAPGQTPAPDPAKEAEQKKQTDAALKGLSDAARKRLDAAGTATRELIAVMLVPGTGKGVKADDAAIDAILKALQDNKVTEAELAELKKHTFTAASSLADVLKSLESGIKQIRGAGKGKGSDAGTTDSTQPDAGTDATKDVPKDTTKDDTKDAAKGAKKDPAAPPPKPVDPTDRKFAKLGPNEFRVSTAHAVSVGTELPAEPAWGKRHGVAWEATVSLKITKAGALITWSSQVRTPTGTLKPWFVGKTMPLIRGK